MADNLDIKDGNGINRVIAATDNAGVHTPKHVVESSALPTGAATAANQTLVLAQLAEHGDFFVETSLGNIAGQSIISKFGAGTLTTTMSPVSQSNTYMTPTTATALEFVSSDAADGPAGIGGREITIIGLDANWLEVSQTLVTNGVTPVALTTPLTRLYRWYVSQSGSYADPTVGSHVGNLTIQGAGASGVWSTIGASPFPAGQSQIGCFTIPKGKTGYLISKNIVTDSTKEADFYFFQRPLADDVTVPYTGTMRLVEREIGVAGILPLSPRGLKGPFVGPCDIGLMGVVSVGTASCSVEFEVLLIDD